MHPLEEGLVLLIRPSGVSEIHASGLRKGADKPSSMDEDAPMRRLGLLLSILLPILGCRGKPLPEPIVLTLPLAESGAPYAFQAHRGDVVLVFFFSTWCVPCQAMEPFVAEAARLGASEGISVVGVALDVDGRRTVAPYVQATAPPYPVLVGGGSVASGRSPFGKIPELPAVLFLDREGRPASSISGLAPTELLLSRAREVQRR